MKIIGYLRNENVYLVDDEEKNHPRWQNLPCGRVLDRQTKTLYPAMPLISLCARDAWKAYQGNQNALEKWLRESRHIG